MYGRIGFRTLGAVVVGALLAGAGVGVSGGLVTESSHPEPGPTIAVTPSTNLIDLQSVLVVGSGFSPNASLGSVECVPAAVDPSSCDLSTLVYASTDGAGVFTLNRPVRRIINVNGLQIDCAAPSTCILGVGNVSDFTESAGASISFDPTHPPVVPHLKAIPATNLRDHQLVTVVGEGFTPGAFVSVSECASEGDFVCAYETNRNTQAGDGGRVLIPNFALERTFLAFGEEGVQTVDCAATPHTCVLQADNGGFGGGTTTASLAFNPSFPPAVPEIKVTPSRSLADLQLVTVRGAGFLPGSSVSLFECATETFACDPSFQNVTAGFRGQFTVTMAVRRLLAGFGPGGIVTTDCASNFGVCSIGASAPGSFASPSAPLGFDPKKPPVHPAMHAIPNTRLEDNQRVGVTLDGFAPFRSVAIVECSADAIAEQNLGYCDGSTGAVTTTPANGGGMSAALFVHRQIVGQDGLVDCAARPGACVLVALPANFFGFPGGGGAGKGGASSRGLSSLAAGPKGWARSAATSRALPAPEAGRPLAAAKDSTIPGIAFVSLDFKK